MSSSPPAGGRVRRFPTELLSSIQKRRWTLLRLAPASASAPARFAVLLISAALLAGCGPDAGSPVGPDAGLEAGTIAPSAGTNIAASGATDIEFGDFALHVPANVRHVRGILVALGGPDTRGFAVGSPFGAPIPAVEASLQELGVMLRDLAARRSLAILGSGRFGPTAFPNEPASDHVLLDAVAQAAALSGRPELVDAPVLLFGLSGGGPEATGFTQRNPERVAALFLRVPSEAGPLTGRALEVPSYMVLSEFDTFVNNAMLTATFQAHRAAGAPWAMALERGVIHFTLTPAQRELTVNWMDAILPFTAAGGTIHQRPPQVGWLGDPTTGGIVPTQRFEGDPATASFFPTRQLAAEWSAFIGY
jgi:hypothetical protein